jgi:outer membrane receptor for ferric coprogen and ferric-rhodotorulic acid
VWELFTSHLNQFPFSQAITNNFSVNTGRDIYGQPLQPSIIDQYEAGVKTDLFKGLVSANLTVYRIVNDNFAQTALVLADGTPNGNNNIKELAGEVTSKGVELDIASKSISGLHSWQATVIMIPDIQKAILLKKTTG